MKTPIKLRIITAAGLIAASQLTMPAFAGESGAASTASSQDAESMAAANTEEKRILRSSDEAYQALRDVQAARLAIFNGEPEIADKLTSVASANLKAAASDAESLSVDTAKAQSNGDQYIPIDMSMSLAAGFEPSDAKAEKLDEANKHIAKGNEKKAAEVLKLANIDVTMRAALLPIKTSIRHADDAINLLSKKKYYEANLALRAIENSIVVEYFGIDAVPAQGNAG